MDCDHQKNWNLRICENCLIVHVNWCYDWEPWCDLQDPKPVRPHQNAQQIPAFSPTLETVPYLAQSQRPFPCKRNVLNLKVNENSKPAPNKKENNVTMEMALSTIHNWIIQRLETLKWLIYKVINRMKNFK